MTPELALFIVLIFTTFIHNGVQLYIHQETYPLLKFVGKAEFGAYLNEYERRLLIPLVLPYALALLSNLILFFVRPANLPAAGLIATLVLNLAVTVVTLVLATPAYNRIKQAGAAGDNDMGQLMRVNLIRLILSTLSSAVVIYLLATLLML